MDQYSHYPELQALSRQTEAFLSDARQQLSKVKDSSQCEALSRQIEAFLSDATQQASKLKDQAVSREQTIRTKILELEAENKQTPRTKILELEAENNNDNELRLLRKSKQTKLISSKMPPFSTDDYHKLLQKIAVMETKIRQLELNAEVNGHYMDETTLPISQNTDREQANGLLTSTTRMQPALREKGNKSTSPPWNSLGAKPKHYKSPPPVMGRRLSGRCQHQETYDSEWPALPSHTAVSSTPAPEKKQPWTKATTKTRSSMPRNTGIPLKNRFAPLSQNPNSSKESPSSTRER